MGHWDYRYYDTGQGGSSSLLPGRSEPNLILEGGSASNGEGEGRGVCSDAHVMDIDELIHRDSPYLLPPKGPQNAPRNRPRATIGLGLPSGIADVQREKNAADSKDKDVVDGSCSNGNGRSSGGDRGRGRGGDGISFSIKPQRMDSTCRSLISGTSDPGLDTESSHQSDTVPSVDRAEPSRNQNRKFHSDLLGLPVPQNKFSFFFTDLRNAYLSLGKSVEHDVT